MAIMLKSDTTGKMEPCTIITGILGSDGNRYGAMADIDALCFAVEVFDPTPLGEKGFADVIADAANGVLHGNDNGYDKNVAERNPYDNQFSDERIARVERMRQSLEMTAEFDEKGNLIGGEIAYEESRESYMRSV